MPQNPDMNRIAKRDDWQNHPMPDARQSLAVDRRYTSREFARLAEGVIPKEMEDKWFIFYEEPWLNLHRSWTGYCVYQVRFEPSEDDMLVAEAIVNRDDSQYTETKDTDDVLLLCILFDGRAARPTEELWEQYRSTRRQD